MAGNSSIEVKCVECGHVFRVKTWIYRAEGGKNLYCERCGSKGLRRVKEK